MPKIIEAMKLKKGRLSSEFWINTIVAFVNLALSVALAAGWLDPSSPLAVGLGMALAQAGAWGYSGHRTKAKIIEIQADTNLKLEAMGSGDNAPSGK